MRVLLAPDCFGGTLTAREAADAMRAGWERAAPADDVQLCPLADGGPGFLDAMGASVTGELVAVTVTSPLGEPVPAAILVAEVDGVRTAYVEAAQAAGLALVPVGRRDPGVTTSYGVGELVGAARRTGAARIVVGVGGTGTNDAGAGLLAALGLGGRGSVLARGGGALGAVTADDVAGLVELRARLGAVEIVGAVDVDVPLLGLQGASAGFAAQKGATPEQAQQLESNLGRFAALVVAALGDQVRPDLLAGAPTGSGLTRLTAAPGAGAGGGVGFGLAALGARLVPGSALVADAVGLAVRIAAVDLVVTGEGTFDWQSLSGKVVAGVAQAGLAHARPVVVIAGQALLGRRDTMELGVSGIYAVAENPDQVAAALADPAGTLSARAARVAATWSPQQG